MKCAWIEDEIEVQIVEVRDLARTDEPHVARVRPREQAQDEYGRCE